MVLFVICHLSFDICSAATLTKIRYKPYDDKIRVVFEMEGEAYYRIKPQDKGFAVQLLNCKTENNESRDYAINDWVVKELKVRKEGNDTVVYFPLEYPVEHKIYPLGSPNRIVIDFGREFSKVETRSRIAEGVEYSFVTKGGPGGYQGIHVLRVDPKKAEIFPALAMRSPTFFQSLANIFTPWQKISRIHFYKEKVSSIEDKHNALAGINGTFFDYTGRPLGVLLINGELISYPIHNRTSVIIDSKNNASIDRVFLDGYVEINNRRYPITGVNQPPENNDVIIFTKHYGELTGTGGQGYELTIENGKVARRHIGNSRIPDNGYVVYFSPMFVENVFGSVKAGDFAKISINIMPFSSEIKNNLLHVMGGGPRLLKDGRLYVSKHYERFRSDVGEGRAARTAVGITKDGQILMVAVDGKPRRIVRQGESYSIGATLEELAGILLSIGAYEALNLDGGGSTTMTVNNRVINRPVENNGSRPVSNALLVRDLD